MVVFLSALLPVKHKEQMLLFLTLGISARWVLWFPISDTSVFMTLRSGYFREGAGGWDGWRSRRLHSPWAVWGLVSVGCQSCPQGLTQPGDLAGAESWAQPSKQAEEQLSVPNPMSQVMMQPNRPRLSAQSEPWAGQAEAEHLFQPLRCTKDLHTPHIPHTVLGETHLPNYRWETEAWEEGKPHSQR